MKKWTILYALAFVLFQLPAQTIQEIATGAGYQKQSFIDLTAGTENQVSNTAWDVAFTVFGQQDAGIFINESSGTSAGLPVAPTELYQTLSDNFEDQPDPAGLTDFRLYNAEKNWNYGAFNEVRDPLNAFDYGWGEYNFQTNQVIGSKVYLLKLHDGTYRKLQIESLIGSTYTFKYAALDGSNLQTKTINKADYAGKTLAYFNLQTNSVVAVEPAGGFDLLYCRYTTWLYDPGSMTTIPYNVTGILHGRGASAVQVNGVNPATVAYSSYEDSLHSELGTIGYGWKTFTGSTWEIPADQVFFLKTANSRVWKLQFIDFEGSSTGKAVFEKTDLGIISAVQDPAALGLKVVTYPNPVQDQLSIALDIPAALATAGQLELVDMQGRSILRRSVVLTEGFQVFEYPAAGWASGTYALRLILPGQHVALGKVIKM